MLLVPWRVRHRALRLLKDALRRYGYRIEKMPLTLIKHPRVQLQIHLEHVVTRYLYQQRPGDFFFIQIGAHDGVTSDPISQLVRRYAWNGLLVEPQAGAFQQLRANYADQQQLQFVNAAIAEDDVEKILYKIREGVSGLPEWYEQIASFERDVILSHRQSIPDIEDLIETETVKCLSFASLIEQYNVNHIDMLVIDAEGYDYKILKMLDLQRCKPAIIYYEYKHLGMQEQNEAMDYLVSYGYKISISGANVIACAAEYE
jgi:FkbM family methyltransferase